MPTESHDTPRKTAAAPEGEIRRLPTRLINQIAAGEVVTRPAAALKELVENSLDAGAGRIEIAVEDDALSFSVRDDGRGMSEADLQLSIERYATSKIRELDDLRQLATRGFRGEALAAISAVSRMELITRTAGMDHGLRLRVSGGRDPSLNDCAANVGSAVTVRDLFFNTPARLKFLKRSVAEWGHMLQTALRQSLTRPDVGFSIHWRGRPYLDLASGQTLAQRLAQVLPGGAGQDLLEVEAALHEVRVIGAVTGPRTTRRDRRHQYFFCNRRPIIFRPLTFAMEEAYKGLIMTQRYPMGAILLDVPGEMVDVNVHPTKDQVRFQNEALISGSVHRAVLETLRAADLIPRLQIPTPGSNLKGPQTPGGLKSAPSRSSGQSTNEGKTTAPIQPGERPGGEALALDSKTVPSSSASDSSTEQLDFVPGFGLSPRDQTGAGHESGQAAGAPPSDQTTPATTRTPYAEPAAQEEADLIARLRQNPQPPRALAQVGETYIVAEAGGAGMLVIDQHAAHEKILYLQYMRQAGRPQTGGIDVQPLLVPHTLELSPADAQGLEALLPALAEAGFEVSPFGGQTYVVQAIPLLLERLDVAAFLHDLIDEIGQGDLPREMQRLRERICARAACRAAVKAGDRLSIEELQRLLDDLLKTEESLRCPHGRPTILLLTREQLDRQFGRI